MNHGFFGRYTAQLDLHADSDDATHAATPPTTPSGSTDRPALPEEDYETGDEEVIALRRTVDATMVEILSLVIEHKADVERAATTPPAEWTSDDLRVAVGSIAALAGIVTGGYARELIEAATRRIVKHDLGRPDAQA